MPRSRSQSVYTASPTRYQQPQRDRSPSEDGSQYEIDLSALGHNSTFESTDLEAKNSNIDVVDTSDIDGPEDFTANLTFYMTAELPLSQIKSRKEANAIVTEVRGDAVHEDNTQDTTEEGDKVIVEDSSRHQPSDSQFDSGSPTVRANGTTDDNIEGSVHSDSSMENDEKVMSYLSALPDSDVQDFVTSTPLRLAKQDMLQVPKHSPPKARSLQATVEDYDTPRKPTQETVIHHMPESTIHMDSTYQEPLAGQIADLQSRLERQELASRTRITELETILAYTRSDLDSARAVNYKQQARIEELQKGIGNTGDSDARLKQREEEMNSRLEEYGEEIRLQGLAKLQNQREEFERRLEKSEEAKKSLEEDVKEKDRIISQTRVDLDEARVSRQQEVEKVAAKLAAEQQQNSQTSLTENERLNAEFRALQARAETLQSNLAKANAEAQISRQEANNAREEARNHLDSESNSQSASQAQTTRVSELEARLQSLQTQLKSSQADASAKDRQLLNNIEEHERLELRLNTAQGRIEGLENTIATLRQQLADSHRDASRSRTDMERYEREATDAQDQLQEARKESDRRLVDAEKKLSKLKEAKIEVEDRLRELTSTHETVTEDHEAQIEDVRAKAEDAVRKAGALLDSERKEKRRLAKELKSTTTRLQKLQDEMAKKAAEEDDDDDSVELSMVSSHSDTKDVELENLRTLLRKQAAAMKTLKSEHSTLRRETASYKERISDLSRLREEHTMLKSENKQLRSDLEVQRSDFEAVNKTMDERIASTLSKALKDRSRTAVSKRDDQWAESIKQLKEEKEFRGRVLLREWGRQECGVAPEKENQLYQYKYTKRT